jgi:hypothetical protein
MNRKAPFGTAAHVQQSVAQAKSPAPPIGRAPAPHVQAALNAAAQASSTLQRSQHVTSRAGAAPPLQARLRPSVVQAAFPVRVGNYMFITTPTAVNHVDEATLEGWVATPLVLGAIAAAYHGAQVDNLLINSPGVFNIRVNIYPAGVYPPLVEVFHADRDDRYKVENRSKMIDRFFRDDPSGKSNFLGKLGGGPGSGSSVY